MPDYTETSWTSVQKHCKSIFGFYPTYGQLRFWWFGNMANKNPQFAVRKMWATREINEWDVIIKLALDYAGKEGNLTTPYKEGDVNRFVYWLLWKTEQKRFVEAIDKKNIKFNAQSFWGWAVEHRRDYEPFVNKTNMNTMKSSARKLLQKMAEGTL